MRTFGSLSWDRPSQLCLGLRSPAWNWYLRRRWKNSKHSTARRLLIDCSWIYETVGLFYILKIDPNKELKSQQFERVISITTSLTLISHDPKIRRARVKVDRKLLWRCSDRYHSIIINLFIRYLIIRFLYK